MVYYGDKYHPEDDTRALAYRRLFATEDGKIVLDSILTKSGVLERIFDGDKDQLQFQNGRRSLGLDILLMATYKKEAMTDRLKDTINKLNPIKKSYLSWIKRN